ncbi:hypothetical protein G6F46_011881 [Rhizopus delemar]|uniref:CCHC-type domain-containing protein n=1 Tax=Rhizopus delemar (strain RA 99-880 / ATCC MYA-4621 / FGSC 9543 / NRRL 43880) TaxID=246409 RepID=I1CSG5_RHIO9|nr:hypothetical protein RO3G_16106 [Rhizopus delemar RA 99-880]KAG1607991.1 hypothetical protein G6F46_011881 [Rhizopus delemar]|eukprot:EIE91395.1 hypothetical protein RO3G_16106 [Rhizopus delemar RA 99-880]
MVLSDNNNFEQNGGLAESSFLTSKATSATSSSTKRSWAQVVTKNRKSLLLSSTTLSTNEPDTNNKKGSTIVKTSIWRPGHGPGSIFVDMTGRKESKVEFLGLVAKQYPSRVGVITQKVGSMKFAEINFDPDDIALNDFLTNGLKFADNSIIIPCRALDSQMEVIRLRLSNLPFLSESALLEGLQKSLKVYGEILDVGILLEPITHTYMCTGYAILNVSSQHIKFKQLTHLIPWDEKREQSFYAVWNQMPHYCRYCHEEGHVVVGCPKRRARTSCWNCGIDGHMAASCTRDKPSKRARKQPEANVAVQSSVEQAPTSLAITESAVTTDTPTTDVDVYPNVENQVHHDETCPHNPPVVIPTHISTSTSSIPVSPGKTGPKRSRVHATQKPYERPVTRSQSTPPKESIYAPSGSVQVGQTDNMDTECSVDPSSSVTPTDEEPNNHMIQ